MFKSIDRSNIVDSIIEQFQVAFMSGELRPGQRLPSESELCAHLDVGRSTLREAMKALTMIGVLEVRRGDGTYVSERITPGAIMPLIFAILVESESPTHLQEFRFMFESGYFKIAAHKASPQDHEAIEMQINKMAEYIKSGGNDPEQLARMDLDFHVAVMEATQNPLILKVGRLLNTMLFELIKRNMAVHGSGEWTVNRHRELLDLIRQRKAAEIEVARLPQPANDDPNAPIDIEKIPPWRRPQSKQ